MEEDLEQAALLQAAWTAANVVGERLPRREKGKGRRLRQLGLRNRHTGGSADVGDQAGREPPEGIDARCGGRSPRQELRDLVDEIGLRTRTMVRQVVAFASSNVPRGCSIRS